MMMVQLELTRMMKGMDVMCHRPLSMNRISPCAISLTNY